MAKTTWIPPRFKNQLHCGIVAGGGGWSQVSQPRLDLITVAPNCHGKTKNLTAKPKTSRQKQNTLRQNRKPHGKNKNLTAKTKYLTTKPKLSRQNQTDLTTKPNTSQQKANTSRQKQIPTAKPKLFCFCREVFCFAVRYFVIAVTVGGHHKFAIASNVRIYYVNVFRRVGGGGGGVQGVRTNHLWDVNIEVAKNPKKIQKTANFIAGRSLDS